MISTRRRRVWQLDTLFDAISVEAFLALFDDFDIRLEAPASYRVF